MSINEQLQQEFSSDDVFPLGTPVFMDTPNAFSPFDQKENETFDEVLSNWNFGKNFEDIMLLWLFF